MPAVISKLPISAVILTYNEAQNLERCLASIRNTCTDIFIVDSGSSDATAAIAGRYGTIVHHSFESHAMQWRWAFANLPITTPWVLALDADQQITPELASELACLFSGKGTIPHDVEGFYINRRQIFRGRWIKHGGYYPKYLLKLFRIDAVTFDPADLVDHHFYVAGRTAKLKNELVENNHKENQISFWIAKHNQYATLLAKEELERRHARKPPPIQPSAIGNPDQRSLWLKRVWYRCPAYVRPFLYFAHRYFFRLGFLDGKEGFIFHFLQAFWFRLLIDINIEEQQSTIVRAQGTKPC